MADDYQPAWLNDYLVLCATQDEAVAWAAQQHVKASRVVFADSVETIEAIVRPFQIQVMQTWYNVEDDVRLAIEDAIEVIRPGFTDRTLGGDKKPVDYR